ncbi:hypothetical protein KXS05_10330 [Rhizobium sp. SA279]
MQANDYKKWVDENIRLIILKDLADESFGGTTNTYLIQKSLERFSYRKSRDYIANQLLWLESEAGAVRTQVAGTETSAILTKAGRDHVEGRRCLAGVQRPGDPD